MFDKKTVIILGAGASVDSGYPTGEALINEIIDLTKVSRSRLSRCIFNKQEKEEKINEIHNSLIAKGYLNSYNMLPTKFFSAEKRLDPTLKRTLRSFLDDGYKGDALLKLCCTAYDEIEDLRSLDILKIHDFQKALQQSMPLSIDTFLMHRESLQKIGKILIAYVLLNKENGSKTTAQENDGKHWYRFLQDALITGCDEPRKILDNKLTIITFNYDLSLEYYLYDVLSKIEFFTDTKEEKNYVEEFFKNLDIIHIYGQLGYFDWHKEKCEELYYQVVRKEDFEDVVGESMLDTTWEQLISRKYFDKNGFIAKNLLHVLEVSENGYKWDLGEETEAKIITILKKKFEENILKGHTVEHNQYGGNIRKSRIQEYIKDDLIKTIGGEKSQKEHPYILKARDALNKAEKVFILGFDFYDDNVNLLKLAQAFSEQKGNNVADYVSGLTRKLYYTNYKNRKKVDRRVDEILKEGLGSHRHNIKASLEDRRNKYVLRSEKELYEAVADDFDLE